jgi:UDP-N-acetyl-D-mannosaminuronic acid dehydrogenase
MKVCVMGLGYIGLPTAVMFAKHGVAVHGVDVNPNVIHALQNRELHMEEPGLKQMLTEVLDEGKLTVSTQPEEADAFLISVPTPITSCKTANLDYVKQAAYMILPYLSKENLVILESTVPPGTVEQLLIPILKKTGYTMGRELFVSHSPERVIPGNLMKEIVWNDRIVGGMNEKSTQLTVELYRCFVKGTIHETDAVTAEMVKLMENTYRDLNIAFANELARIAEKIGFNVWEAIDLANSHPRVHIHQPGPGVGGHCIAVDPWFIVEKAPVEAKLISLARSINDSTPFHIVERIEDLVKDVEDPIITLLGLAFKDNIDDMRESPSVVIMKELKRKGYRLKVFDPYVKEEVDGKVATLEEAEAGSDCLVIVAAHQLFQEINFRDIHDLLRTKIILDTRNIVEKDHVTGLGISCIQIGVPIQRGGD